MDFQNILSEALSHQTFGGMLIVVWLIGLIALFGTNNKNTFWVLFGSLYESMMDFFTDILGEEEYLWIKSFITNLFFVILIFNLLGLLFDFFSPIFGFTETGEFAISEKFGFATSNVEFNVAMALIWVLITLVIQLISWRWKIEFAASGMKPFSDKPLKLAHPSLKILNFLYEYFPFRGKDIITIEKGSMNPALFYLARPVIKIFDIIISLFVGFLDIIGILAKVISLAFRLFGNMMSGTVLLSVLMVGLSAATAKRFGGVELPLLAPIILFLQWLLVACIQALVFPLLIAIYVKVARMWWEEEAVS